MAGSYKGITVDIVFKGDTTKFKDAVNEVDSNLKGIDRTLKTVNSGLKLDPTNVELVRQKFSLMGEKVNEVQKKLDLFRQSQKEVEKAFREGKIDSQQWADYNRELARTEDQLKKLRDEYKTTIQAMTSDLGESVEELTGFLSKAAAGVTAVITALGGMTMSAAQATDELNTMSKITGISVEELQKFQYASKLVDVSQETLAMSLRKLTANMQNAAKTGKGEAYDAFDALHVKITDTNGKLRDSQAVFNELIDALNKVENQTERDAYAIDIFGRSAAQLNPLIVAGSQVLKDYGDQADRMGLIFDDDTLNGLQEFQDRLDISKRQLEGIKTIVGGEMADAFDTLYDGIDDLLKLVQKAKKDGTLKAVAKEVASALSTLMSILTSLMKAAYDLRVEIAAAATGLLTFKAALSIAKTVEAFITTIVAMKAALTGATAAQAGLNAAMIANPYALLAAGIAAVATALTVYIVKAGEAAQIVGEASDEAKEYAKANDELLESIRQSNEERDKSIKDIGTERDVYTELTDKIFDLAEAENLSASEKRQLGAYVDELNSKVPQLGLSFNSVTGELSMQRDEVKKLIDAYETYMEVQARTQYGSELLKEQFELEREYEEAQEKYENAKAKAHNEQAIKAQEEAVRRASEDLDKADASNYKKRADAYEKEKQKLRQLRQEQENAKATLTEYAVAYKELGVAVRDNTEKQEENKEKLKEASDSLSDADEQTKRYIESVRNSEKATEDLTKKENDLSKAYENTVKAVSTYKSQLKDLISVLDNVNNGTAYSTTQLLDLIEKYPELTRYINETTDGYTLQADAVRALTQAKAEHMITEAEMQLGMLDSQVQAANDALNSASVIQTITRNGKTYRGIDTAARDAAQQALQEVSSQRAALVQQIEGYRRIADSISSGRIYSGSSTGGTSSGSTGSSYSSSGKSESQLAWEAMEKEDFSKLEYRYKMGEIEAEQYYDELRALGEKYYSWSADKQDEWRNLQVKIYQGLQKLEEDRAKAQENKLKAQEEELANTKSMIDTLRDLKEAQDELNRAEKQEVQVYSGTAGFHSEKNTSAIDAARTSLADKNFALTQTLLKLGNFNGESLAERMKQIGSMSLRDLLPDLSGLTLPSISGSSTTNNNTNRTVNYTAGDIIVNIEGSADEQTVQKIQGELKEAFEKYMDDFLDAENRAGQTGGVR